MTRLLAGLGVAAVFAVPIATVTSCDRCPNLSYVVSANPRCPR